MWYFRLDARPSALQPRWAFSIALWFELRPTREAPPERVQPLPTP